MIFIRPQYSWFDGVGFTSWVAPHPAIVRIAPLLGRAEARCSGATVSLAALAPLRCASAMSAVGDCCTVSMLNVTAVAGVGLVVTVLNVAVHVVEAVPRGDHPGRRDERAGAAAVVGTSGTGRDVGHY